MFFFFIIICVDNSSLRLGYNYFPTEQGFYCFNNIELLCYGTVLFNEWDYRDILRSCSRPPVSIQGPPGWNKVIEVGTGWLQNSEASHINGAKLQNLTVQVLVHHLTQKKNSCKRKQMFYYYILKTFFNLRKCLVIMCGFFDRQNFLGFYNDTGRFLFLTKY